MRQNFVYTILIIVLIVIGAWLRLDNLGDVNFQNDEFFHIETAQGYLETGGFVMWDFINEEPTGDYIRAFPYTWLVAQSSKIFGLNEFSGRLPSAIFGILFLPLIYLLAFGITKSHLASTIVLALAVFDNSLIWASRTCRMYSMLLFFILPTTYFLYKGLEDKKKYIYLPLGIIFLAFSYLVHEVALILALGFLFYFVVNAIKDPKNKKYLIVSLVGVTGLVGGLLFNFFVHPLTTNDFFTLRTSPNWIYFKYPFNQLYFWELGWLFLILGVALWDKFNKLKIYYLSLFVPILIFFVFFAERYAAKKYILFVIPFMLIFYSDGLVNIFKKLFAKKQYLILAIIAVLLLTGPNILQPTRASQDYSNFEYHNFSAAYSYIEQNYKSGEPILILRQHEYYFSRQDLNLVKLTSDKGYTVQELKDLQAQYPSGWVIWPKYKSYHLTEGLKNYCEKNLEYIEEIKDTNLEVYHFVQTN